MSYLTPPPLDDQKAHVGALNVTASAATFFAAFLEQCQSQPLRGIMEWAETEVTMPMDGGPRQGQPFSRDFQPYVVLLYHEIEHGPWSLILCVGPSQSGKTFCSFVLPVLWVVTELKQNIVVGIPDENMINDKWEVDMKPVFEASPALKSLLPRSRATKIKTSVRLTNGRLIRFMTKGGSDQSKAGFTSPIIAVTEIAGFSAAQETSKEADAFAQLQGRQKSKSRYKEDGSIDTARRIFAEGTVTDEEDLPWREYEESTQSRLLYECVHCQKYMRCERQDLHGWQGASSAKAAGNAAYFACPECNEPFSEIERELMVRTTMRLVHRDQQVDQAGNVVGPPPESTTLWYRWSAWDNLFLRPADFADEEWQADRLQRGTPAHDNAERQLCQQTWAIPYEPILVGRQKLDAKTIAKRGENESFAPGLLPADTNKLVYGIDVGLWECWYHALCGRDNGTMHNPNYGRVETSVTSELKSDKAHVQIAVVNTLLRLFRQLDQPLAQLGQDQPRVHDGAFIDAKYLPDAVFQACRIYGQETGDFKRYIPLRGQGKSAFLGGTVYKTPSKTSNVVRKISASGMWHEEYIRARGLSQVVVDVDRTKLDLQAALAVAPGLPGSLTIYYATARDHRRLGSHYAAEIKRVMLEDGELIEEWKRKGANHLLDSGGYAYARLDYEGWSLPLVPHDHQQAIESGHYPSAVKSHLAPPSPSAGQDAIVKRLRQLGLL